MSTADDYLTTTQVGALLGIPPATLRQWRHKKCGPRSFNLGSLVRYRRDDVETWVAHQYQQTATGGIAP